MSTSRVDAAPATLTRPAAYLALTKPDVTFLVVITTLAGFYLGSSGPLDFGLMAATIIVRPTSSVSSNCARARWKT